MKQSQGLKFAFALLLVLAPTHSFAQLTRDRKPIQLDDAINESVTEHQKTKRAYDEKMQITRTNQFAPEQGAVEVEMGGQLSDWDAPVESTSDIHHDKKK